MNSWQLLILALVVFVGCFLGGYYFFMEWAFHHIVWWYLFCLIIEILIIFRVGSVDE